MPVYEYECEQCGTRFERLQSIKDDPVRQCPECSGTVHKVFHPAGIIFKGSGWYMDGGPRPANFSEKFLMMWPGLDRCATIGFRCVVDLEA